MALAVLKKLKRVLSTLFSEEKVKSEKIGEVRIGPNSYIEECEFGIYNTVGKNCFMYKSKINDFTYLGPDVSMMNCQVGKFCSIAPRVGIGMGDHPSKNFVSTHPAFFSTYKQCGYSFTDESLFPELGRIPNKIGNDVWIGANVVVLNNVSIADGAIIGAGAIVTKDVPAYSVSVGNPARIIRYRFSEEDIEFLLNLKWWDRDIEWLSNHHKSFQNINTIKAMFRE